MTRKPGGKETIPRPPSHLSPASKRWWREIVGQYVLGTHHLKLLGSAAHCLDRIEATREILKTEGLVVKDRFGQPKPHPATLIERDQKSLFARLVNQLGFDLSNQPESRRGRGGGYR